MKQYAEIARFLTIMLCYLGYVWTANSFCKAYLKISKKKELLFLVFLFGCWLLINTITELCSVPYIVFALGSHLSFTGLILLLFQADWEKKLLAASMFSATITLAGNFCDSFFSSLALLCLHTINGITEPYLGEREFFLIFCLRSAVVMFILHQMSKHRILVFQNHIKKWHILLSLFLFVITLITDIADWGAANGILIKGEETMSSYHNQLLSHAEICVLTALSALAAYFYVFGMDRITLEQRKRSSYDAQIAAYQLLEKQHRKSERLRHDMKNHILALSGLLESKEYEKLSDYLNSMRDSESLVVGLDATGNQAIDALLYQKREMAESCQIAWECDVHLPKPCCINEFDLCVLFGNILDNALEACNRQKGSKQRFIHVQAKTVKKCFLLEAKNSTDETEYPKNGHTSKANPKEHGIGLLNIHDVVHKYHGTMDIEVGNGCFIISILIPF